MTDLLYQKHTQLERMAAEKAAQRLTMEREIATAREYAERNHRSAHPVAKTFECNLVNSISYAQVPHAALLS